MRGLACVRDGLAQRGALARALTHASCLSLLLTAADALAQTPPAAEALVLQDSATEEPLAALLRSQTDALGRPCTMFGLARSGELRIIACGQAGLWIVRMVGAQARVVELRDLGGSAVGLFSADNQLWVQVNSVRAQPLALRATHTPSAPPQPSASPPPAPAPAPTITRTRPEALPMPVPIPPRAAKIRAREDALITIEVAPGSEPPPGTRIAFTKLVTDARGEREEKVYAVGHAVSRSVRRAKVQIGINEDVPADASARVTSLPTTASVFAPPRARGIWEMSFLARPFLVLDDLGLGGVLDAEVGYRMDAPVHFCAALTPLAFGTARAGAMGTFAGMIMAAYDSHAFEAGLGLGVQTINDPGFGLDRGSGTLVAERVRIGARDGAHLELQSHVVLFHRSFEFSDLRVTAQIPLGARTWLHAAGGGGSMGLATGELGVRQLLTGNGGSGSVFFTALVGWAAVFRGCNVLSTANNCIELDYQGPMLGAGAEFRR